MHYDWILFDADHTLFDFDKSSEESLLEVLAHHGIPPQKRYWPWYDKINRECWAAFENGEMAREVMRVTRFSRFFEQIGVAGIDIEVFATDYLRILPTKPHFMRGATELLVQLHGRIRLGVITNGLREVQRPRLTSTGVDRFFDVIVISGEIDLSKPDEAFFEHTHIQMGCPDKERVLVVGDSLNADIRGGGAFGFRTCWFNPGKSPMHLSQPPDYEIEALDQILPLTGIV